MLPAAWVKDYDRRRLRILLGVLFLALAVPTGIVVWQAYGRLKWETFHQFRGQAEELTRRIDSRIAEQIAAAEARSFADFSFINVSGDPDAGVLQRSALSAYPVAPELPGIIGYFQVDASGIFSTPLLPGSDTDPAAVGIGAEEYQARRALTLEIRQILADNRLVGERTAAAAPLAQALAPAAPAGEADSAFAQSAEREGREDRAEYAAPARQAVNETYSQQVFDQLSEQARRAQPAVGGSDAKPELASPDEDRANLYGKVRDLQFDDALNRKSESLEESVDGAGRKKVGDESQVMGAERSRRLEKASLPASSPPLTAAAASEGASEVAREGASVGTRAGDLRITTFESEVDPYEFSLLGSGHFVLFRNVWRDGERYIQGALIEQRAFLGDVIEAAYRDTTLPGMSELVVGYRGDVIDVIHANAQDRYPLNASGMQGALLYRNRLSAPLDSLELIFSLKRLPPGPGASVLGWTSLLLAAVFFGGFYALYRLGMGQIRLARQQQDFVSAVSHELKTPLTSIRMYGEMLKEGWADDAKRQQYYAYIHDESERLTRLIENILQLANITRNGLRLDLRPIGVGELVERVRAKISHQVERAGFELTVAIDEDTRKVEVLMDEDCFVQIAINLVDNAIKFSRTAGTRRIDIRTTAERVDRVRFSVRDYGPGVPRDQMKKIFRLFYRTESELTRETVGTGIGLAIVHQLATAMSGKVDVLNRDPGAEFGISFPIQVG
ncbi:MAG: sensor histidine kinase [Lysobacterales bacterium]